jgi:hypothetical protein
MATYTPEHLSAAGSVPKDSDPTKKPGRGTLFLRTVHIDFDAFATNHGITLGNADVYQVFHLSPGEIVIQAGIAVHTAATAAADINLGLGALADGIIDGMIMDDAHIMPTVTAINDWHPYVAAADTLDLTTATQTCAAAVVTVWALIGRI